MNNQFDLVTLLDHRCESKMFTQNGLFGANAEFGPLPNRQRRIGEDARRQRSQVAPDLLKIPCGHHLPPIDFFCADQIGAKYLYTDGEINRPGRRLMAFDADTDFSPRTGFGWEKDITLRARGQDARRRLYCNADIRPVLTGFLSNEILHGPYSFGTVVQCADGGGGTKQQCPKKAAGPSKSW